MIWQILGWFLIALVVGLGLFGWFLHFKDNKKSAAVSLGIQAVILVILVVGLHLAGAS